MTPDELERALRDCLDRQAAVPQPASADPARTALRRARRIHRRRTVAGAALAALATVVASVGVAQFGGTSGQAPGPTVVVLGDPPDGPTVTPPTLAASESKLVEPTGPPRVDLVVSHDLSTAGGDVVDLSVIGTILAAQRTTGGWLVTGGVAPGRSSLWFISTDREPQRLLPNVDSLALAADGQRVAWRDGSQLFAAAIRHGALAYKTWTDAPARGVPIGFVGVAVLLRRDGAAGSPAYDLWWPSREPYQESWTTVPVGVYGTLPDGQTVVGQVAAGTPPRPCLALLDASRRLTPTRTACSLPLSAGGRGAVSPDGRWLVANGSVTGGATTRQAPPAGAASAAELALVVDLGTVFGKAPAASDAGPRLTGDAVWTDDRTLVHADDQGDLVRVLADRVAAGNRNDVERFTAPGAVPGDQLVLVTGDGS